MFRGPVTRSLDARLFHQPKIKVDNFENFREKMVQLASSWSLDIVNQWKSSVHVQILTGNEFKKTYFWHEIVPIFSKFFVIPKFFWENPWDSFFPRCILGI